MSTAEVRGRVFEGGSAPFDLDEIVGGRKEPPAEWPEPGRSEARRRRSDRPEVEVGAFVLLFA